MSNLKTTERRTGPGEGFAELARVVRDVAKEHGVRHGYDELGEPIVPGKRGHLYHDGERWCWCFAPDHGVAPWSRRILGSAKADPRLEILVEGDEEAVFAIRDENDLREIGIRWCQCRKRRTISEEQKARLVEAGKATRLRSRPGATGAQADRIARQTPDATETTSPASPGEMEA